MVPDNTQSPSHKAAPQPDARANSSLGQTPIAVTQHNGLDAPIGRALHKVPLDRGGSQGAPHTGEDTAPDPTAGPRGPTTPVCTPLCEQSVNAGAAGETTNTVRTGTDHTSGSVLNPLPLQHPRPASNAHGPLGAPAGLSVAQYSATPNDATHNNVVESFAPQPGQVHAQPAALSHAAAVRRHALEHLEALHPLDEESRRRLELHHQKGEAKRREKQARNLAKDQQRATSADSAPSGEDTAAGASGSQPGPGGSFTEHHTFVHRPAPKKQKRNPDVNKRPPPPVPTSSAPPMPAYSTPPPPLTSSTTLASTNPAPPPPSVDWDQYPQVITSNHDSYIWSARLYNVDLERTGYCSARDWVQTLISRQTRPFQWYAHISVGFIQHGDIRSILVLHNAANPFHHNLAPAPHTTSLGVYECSANHIFWWTIEPSLVGHINQCIDAGTISQVYKWNRSFNATEKRFHKGYFLAASMQSLGCLLNRADPSAEQLAIEQAMTQQLQGDRFDKITKDSSPEDGYTPSDFEPNNDGVEDIDEEEAEEIWNQCLAEAQYADVIGHPDCWIIGTSEREMLNI